MAILLNFGVAAPLQNYDVTSRASNDARFKKKFNTRVFSPKCTIMPSLAKCEQVVFFWYSLMYIFCHCLSHYYLATVTYCNWSVKEGQQEKIVLNKVQINCESSLACSNL